MAWIILLSGTLISVMANALLKQSDGFAHIWLGLTSFVLFGVGIYLYGIAVKTLPIGVAYAVWSGVGVIVVTAIGILWFKEHVNYLTVLFMVMIITGCIGLNLVTRG